MRSGLVMAAVMAGAQAVAQEAREPVDLELVLLADASGSIDDVETRLQRQGYAAAMADPEVLWAIENGGEHGRIAVAFVEWAGARSQDVVVDWMVVEDGPSAEAFGARLMAAPRRATGTNAIGAAILKGLALIEGNGFEGWRKVIDLSGDSIWNPRPPTIAARAGRGDRPGGGGERARHPLRQLLGAPRRRQPRGGLHRAADRRARARSWSRRTGARPSRRRCGAS